MRTARFGRGGAGILLILLGLTEGGCSLILDFSEAGADAGPPDAAPTPDGPGCDTFEPNDTLATATPLTPGNYVLGICDNGDHDYFQIALDGNQDLTVRIDFDNANGDLEMRLYDSLGGRIDQSQSFNDFEQIIRSVAEADRLAAGTYFVEIYGFNDTATNDYELTLTITP
jgi:hypothetical protein